MNWLLDLFMNVLREQAKLRLLGTAGRFALLAYMRLLRGVRRLTVVTLVAFLAVQMMMLAGFGALTTGILLWDADTHTKLQILFAIFSILFILPAAALLVLTSERLWFRASGAERLMDKLDK